MLARAAALIVVLACAPRAHADEWFGSDKALHFGASAAIASGGYALTTAFTDHRSTAFLVGGGVALGAGIAKEAWDATGRGDPSWKDFTWDVVGTIAGLVIAYGVDQLVRPDRPGEARAAIADCRLSTVDCRLAFRF